MAAVFAFFFSAYIFTASGDIYSTGDTTIRIEVAENILGRFSVVLNGWNLQYPHHFKSEYLDPRVSVGTGGNTFSTYLPGQPLAIVPFELIGQRVAIQEMWPYGPTVFFIDRLVGPLFGALEVMVFFLFAFRLGWSLWKSLILSLILAFATSVWPDEQSVLEHTEVAFSLLLAFYFAFRFRDGGRGWKYLVWAGFAMGVAMITRYQDAFLGSLGIALYLALPGPRLATLTARLRALILYGAAVTPFVLIDAYYDWYRFGSITASGHHERVFGYPIWLGASGLVFSPGKGVLWYCPTIFLLVIALPRFYRRFPALSVAIVATFAVFTLLYGYVEYWHGDPAWGPRYMYPTVPLLTLPLGELLTRAGRRAWAVLVLTATVVLASFTIQLAGTSVSQWRGWYRVISYEENQGHIWQWIASHYDYFWNYHESPLNFQLHGLYQMAYDSLLHSNKYEIVPPNEDPVLDNLASTYAVNQWSYWWAENEFNWWMGEDKVIGGMILLMGIMLASGTYIAAEAAGLFGREPRRLMRPLPIDEAA